MSYVVVEQTDGRYAVFGGNGVICVSDEIEDARTIRDALNHVPYAVERAALLREWLDTEIDPEDEEYGPWMESFTARVKAAISGLEISNVCPDCKGGGTRMVPGTADDADTCPTCVGTGDAIGPILDHDQAWEAFYEWCTKRPAGWHLANQEQKQHDAFMAGVRWFQTCHSQGQVCWTLREPMPNELSFCLSQADHPGQKCYTKDALGRYWQLTLPPLPTVDAQGNV